MPSTSVAGADNDYNSDISEGSSRYSAASFRPGEDGNPSVNMPGFEEIKEKKTKKDQKRENSSKKANDRNARKSSDGDVPSHSSSPKPMSPTPSGSSNRRTSVVASNNDVNEPQMPTRLTSIKSSGKH